MTSFREAGDIGGCLIGDLPDISVATPVRRYAEHA